MSVQESSTRGSWPPTRQLALGHSKGQASHPVRWCRSLALVLVMLPLATFAAPSAQEGEEPSSRTGVLHEQDQEQDQAPSVQVNINCEARPVVIRSLYAALYVAADLNYPWNGPHVGVLRARTPSTQVGQWELFTLCREYGGTGGVFIRSVANGLYVAAELGSPDNPGMLRARTHPNDLGDWERFKLTNIRTGVWLIKSVANDRYVAAETRFDQFSGMLRARTPLAQVGRWEEFGIYRR